MIAHPDRNQKGRFVAGNKSAAGRRNPLAARATLLRRAAMSEITPDELRRMMRAMWLEAVDGSVSAAEFCMKWTVGRPFDPALDARLSALECAAGIASPMLADDDDGEFDEP